MIEILVVVEIGIGTEIEIIIEIVDTKTITIQIVVEDLQIPLEIVPIGIKTKFIKYISPTIWPFPKLYICNRTSI